MASLKSCARTTRSNWRQSAYGNVRSCERDGADEDFVYGRSLHAYALVTGPAQEPITLDEARRQARIVGEDSDTLLRSYIVTARQEAETTMRRALFTQTWRHDLEEFEEVMPLPMAALLQSVAHVKYYDTDGVLQTLSASYYEVDTLATPGRIVRAPDVSWPALQADRRTGRVQITYVAGWATVASIPEKIKQGIRMYVTYLDADRDGMDAQATAARESAAACWSDVVHWVPACE